MPKTNRIIALSVIVIMLSSLCACGLSQKGRSGNGFHGQDVNDAFYYDEKYDVDCYVFCADRNCIVATPGESEWTLTYKIPYDIEIEDGEFALVNADITYVSGGVAGYYKAPRFDKVNSRRIISPEDVENAGSLIPYNPEDDSLNDIGIYRQNDSVFLITHVVYNEFRLYKDGSYVASYDNLSDVNTAIGITD
ncbi:MAG: hypothetical protein J6U67_08440 [Lachnospiraceae bacterium]|nr:hypothetical protein [Lachnospiraceae bacterium]